MAKAEKKEKKDLLPTKAKKKKDKLGSKIDKSDKPKKKEKKDKSDKKTDKKKDKKKAKKVKTTQEVDDELDDALEIKMKLKEEVIAENSKAVINRPLPPMPTGDQLNGGPSIVLFYQYMEPVWSKKKHKEAVAKITALARDNGVTGRGRCAPEGLNSTLTGPPEGIRAFCMGLRKWNKTFENTDFKITDGLESSHRFKSLNIRKTEELVGYGLGGRKAPDIQKHGGVHLEALEYHKMMEEKNTVIIDVRNQYETTLGHFNPPTGGAKLIDPKMRNSNEFPGWLNAPNTRKELQGKKVMMYCTGGIRCERATALLNELTEVDNTYDTKGVYMIRGGIERYIKTFPEGGHWKGKNYTFDRRFVQVPEKKAAEKLEKDIESKCCLCARPWDQYRGQFKCFTCPCPVPVLVCSSNTCQQRALNNDGNELQCALCQEGYQPPTELPDLEKLKQEADKRKEAEGGCSEDGTGKRKTDAGGKGDGKKQKTSGPSTRLFVGNLPYIVNVSQIEETLKAGKFENIQWLTNKQTKLFYGSAFVQFAQLDDAKAAVATGEGAGVKMNGRKLRVNFAPPREGEVWPPKGHENRDRPPVS